MAASIQRHDLTTTSMTFFQGVNYEFVNVIYLMIFNVIYTLLYRYSQNGMLILNQAHLLQVVALCLQLLPCQMQKLISRLSVKLT